MKEEIGEKKFVKFWTNQILSISTSNYEKRLQIYREALKYIPSSFKIWKWYLSEICIISSSLFIGHTIQNETKEAFEKCLLYFHKYPRVWLLYAKYLEKLGYILEAKLVYDRSLVSLPVSQHDKIWNDYIKFAEINLPTNIFLKIGERYCYIEKGYKEVLADKLLDKGMIDYAVKLKIELLDDVDFVSTKHPSKYDSVMEVLEILNNKVDSLEEVKTEPIFRHFLNKYSDEVGNMWLKFADHYIRKGMFEKARLIFQEALNEVKVGRDFGVIYNAYLKFEEEILKIIFEEGIEEEVENDEKEYYKVSDEVNDLLNEYFTEREPENKENNKEIKEYKIQLWSQNSGKEEELRMQKLEDIIKRRELFLNSCLIRQDKSVVKHWINRMKLIKNNSELLDKTFDLALAEIDIIKSKENLSLLFISYAQYHFNKQNYSK